MWLLLRSITGTKEGAPYPPESLGQVAGFLEVQERIDSKARLAVERQLGPKRAPDREAVIRPPVWNTAWLQAVPVAMFLLGPIWESDVWSDEQYETAIAAATFFGKQDGAPRLEFEKGEHHKNHEELGRLLEWFESEVSEPSTYAHMIMSRDEGPWRAVPMHSANLPPPLSNVRVGIRLELRLHVYPEMTPPWVLQCLRDGEPVWTKRITEIAGDRGLTFDGAADARALGPYGWKAYMRFGVRRDIEEAILYLDPQGELLFYFTTW